MERIAYQRADVFQYEFFTDVWFAGVGSDARYFVHQARDRGEARTLWDQLLEEQSFDYAELDRTDDLAVLRHRNLKTVFAVGIRGALVLGVEGAADEAGARRHLQRLREAERVSSAYGCYGNCQPVSNSAHG